MIVVDCELVGDHERMNRVVEWFKIAIGVGVWVYVDRMETCSYDEMVIVVECLEAVSNALAMKDAKVVLLGDELKLHPHAQIFMSLSSLTHSHIPSHLFHKLRPMYISKPDDMTLLRLYL